MKRSRVRRAVVVTAGVFLVLAALVAVQPGWLVDLVARSAPGLVFRVPTQAPLVALTFDDGPDPAHTPAILDILKRHHARATFFLIGGRAARHPDLVSRIRQEGHAVGNHTGTTRSTWKVPGDRFEEDLLQAERILRLETPKLFRPAGGLIRPAQRARAASLGYTIVLGSAYPYDPARPPTAYMEWLVARNLRPGAIVVLHDAGGDRSRSVAAVDGILRAGEVRGLRWVTLPELLAAGAHAH